MAISKITSASYATLDATKLSGNLPAISAANLTSIPAANIAGTLPAINGGSLTGITTGKILQYAVDNDGDFIDLSSTTSWTDTALSIAFTPIASNSTIVVKGMVNVYTGGNSGSYHGLTQYKLQKDGSDFGETYNNYSGYTSNAALFTGPLPFNVQESAGSTSARTYKVQIRNASTQTYSSHNQYSGKSVLEIFEVGA
tara:strand:- start:536 stop:1129 length:594 start_codon:yes stop_codon:yes gene_type:complete